MTHVITDPCIAVCDTACVEVCPVDCIHPTKEEWSDDYKASLEKKQLYINPEECIDCGACVPECPVEAIYPDDTLPDDQEHQIAINEEYYN
ncbi:ferredoxin [PVC group bacterium (ex Bugula neritina AB1)]|nr:ferredoxin [PVC group bacterium (ex Bugula neritina AB1)]